MVLLRQNSLAPSLTHGKKSNHISNNYRREEEPTTTTKKNRWVSTERNAGTAMGAVCDWSIASFSKPFFSHHHVQRVDKRHHPTDSLINCEMRCYLLLSYSRHPPTPRNPLCFLPFPACKVKKQAGLHQDSFS